MLLSLSILIASLSFLCYKHPPLSWPFLQWLLRPSIQDSTAKTEDAPIPPPKNDDPATPKMQPVIILEEEKTPTDASPNESKQALDRKAMPPPPLLLKPISISNPQPSHINNDTTPTIPTFTLANPQEGSDDTEDYDAMPPPSFPAMNSAQRASNIPRGPPRLNALPPPPSSSSSLTAGLTLSPSRSLPLPNRNPSQNPNANARTPTTGLAPPPTHTSPPTKPRQKVLLTPGHSPLDWARLTSSPSANLRGLPPSTPYLKVPPSLLKTYNGRPSKTLPLLPNGQKARTDAWTVLGGKVYNITPYLPYHPGGEPELLRVAGKDGTKLFREVHPWVNWEGMLEGCLIGVAVSEEEVGRKASLEEMD